MKWLTAVALGIASLSASSAQADSWAHWRGPTGNGVSTTAKPPVEWSDSHNIKWKLAVPGRSSASPVIWENRVFVVTAETAAAASDRRLPKLRFKTLCLDRGDGSLLWEQTAVEAIPHQETHATNSFASASPCTDGQRVYAHFGSRGLYCYDMDGQLLWKRTDFPPMSTRNGFGEGSSPTLEGDMLLLPWDHEGESFLFALDKSTGNTIWKAPRDEPTCWATPLVVGPAGKRQVVMNGQQYARSYDLQSGEELWRCSGQTQRPAASPVAMGDLVFVGSGHRGAFMGAFKFEGSRGDIRGSKQVAWSLDRDTPDVASPLLSDGRLYFYKGRTGTLTCVDAQTGKTHFASRIPGLGDIYASPIAAGGHIYLADRAGTVVVIKDAAELEIVKTNHLNETIDATPAPVDDELFIRGDRHLFCISQEAR